MKILIVDDELDAQNALHTLLLNYCNSADSYLFANNVVEAVNVIRKEEPNLVFLDVEMPRHSGFELFDFIKEINFQVVFVTAYDQYAIKAFEFSAIDYLLKPIEPKRLVNAYNRAAEKENHNDLRDRYIQLKNALTNNFNDYKITIPVAFGEEYIMASQIIAAKADGAYTELILEDKENLFLSKRISLIEKLFDDSNFYRLNRSYMVNLNKITKISKKDGGVVYLTNGYEIPINKEVRDKLSQKMNQR